MCGILCSVTHDDSYSHPRFLSYLNKSQISNTWELYDASTIKESFIEPLNAQIHLSQSDQNKLEHMEELFELNQQLVKLKNNIKNDHAIASRALEIENKIRDIVGDTSDFDIGQTLTAFEQLMMEIAARGPDYLAFTHIKHSDLNVNLFSSVLSLRQPFQTQPVHCDDFILQFNGELYNENCLLKNDTEYIEELLSNHEDQVCSRRDRVLKTISKISGEYAFVITDLLEGKVYYGRDYIGKRSLMLSYDKVKKHFMISSLPTKADFNFQECPSKNIYVLNLADFNIDTISYEHIYNMTNSPNLIRYCPLQASMEDKNYETSVNGLYEVLKKSTSLRSTSVNPLHPCSADSEIGVLFSGGIDCTLIAALICENIRTTKRSIDLITVGFENPRTGSRAYDSPDRVLSRKSWFHLASKYNSENFDVRLLEVDVSYESWLMHRKRVENLMYPSRTEMDLSIAIAFYFASMAQDCTMLSLSSPAIDWGEFQTSQDQYISRRYHYTSSAKVLFSGLGADELFAGYSRHESIFNTLPFPDDQNYSAVLNEKYGQLSSSLINDIQIIDERNLGRDDRVISSWGKELRYPFLDHEVINFAVNKVSPDLKLSISWAPVQSKKKGKILRANYIRKFILRELASYMKLDWVRDELKRAIQFGAKSAKMEVGQNKVRGTDKI